MESFEELLPVQQHGCGGCYGAYELKNFDFKVYKITEEKKEARKESWCLLMIWGIGCCSWRRAAPHVGPAQLLLSSSKTASTSSGLLDFIFLEM